MSMEIKILIEDGDLVVKLIDRDGYQECTISEDRIGLDQLREAIGSS